MNTIEKIIKKSWYSKKEILFCSNCNWCWWKWWINFEEIMKSLPFFNTDKWEELFNDLHIICNLHDMAYNNWKSYYNFILAN